MLGNLLVITPRFVGCLIAAAAVAWVVVTVAFRRRRRWPVLTLAVVLALSLTAASGGDAVNAHYQFMPRVNDVIGIPTWPQTSLSKLTSTDAVAPPANRYPAGTVVPVPLAGPVSGFGSPRAMVYLPPQYFTQPQERFPVVYLLHGSPGAPVDWFRAARAAQAGLAVARAGSPVILVAPRVSRRWTDDSECVDRPSERVETYVTRDVVPDIDRLFRTDPNRAGRAVAGMSAGGYCALNIGLRNRQLFSTIIDMSGYDQPTHDGGMRVLYQQPDTVAGRRQAQIDAAADSPSDYLSRLPRLPLMRVWLDCGRTDLLPRRQLTYVDKTLVAHGQQAMLTIRPGGHDYGVWRPALAAALAWAAPGMRPTSATPRQTADAA